MQLDKQLLGPRSHPFVRAVRARIPLVLATFAMVATIAIHIGQQQRIEEMRATCAVQSNHAYAPDWIWSLQTDAGDVKINQTSVQDAATFDTVTTSLTSSGANALTNIGTYNTASGARTTYSIPRAYDDYAVGNSSITDDGATITVDLDRIDRAVVVKRPGTADSVTITKVPLVFEPFGTWTLDR